MSTDITVQISSRSDLGYRVVVLRDGVEVPGTWSWHHSLRAAKNAARCVAEAVGGTVEPCLDPAKVAQADIAAPLLIAENDENTGRVAVYAGPGGVLMGRPA